MRTDNTAAHAVRIASTVTGLAGISAFIAPWIYGPAWNNPVSWNCWLLGPLVMLLAITRWNDPLHTRGLGLANVVLGAWLFVAPWPLGYTANTGYFINSLCAGFLIFALSLYGLMMMATRVTGMPRRL